MWTIDFLFQKASESTLVNTAKSQRWWWWRTRRLGGQGECPFDVPFDRGACLRRRSSSPRRQSQLPVYCYQSTNATSNYQCAITQISAWTARGDEAARPIVRFRTLRDHPPSFTPSYVVGWIKSAISSSLSWRTQDVRLYRERNVTDDVTWLANITTLDGRHATMSGLDSLPTSLPNFVLLSL